MVERHKHYQVHMSVPLVEQAHQLFDPCEQDKEIPGVKLHVKSDSLLHQTSIYEKKEGRTKKKKKERKRPENTQTSATCSEATRGSDTKK